MKISEDLVYEILSAVSEIPEGKVAIYGQIAALIGRERNARLVGKVLSVAGYYGDYPCHRVVNAAAEPRRTSSSSAPCLKMRALSLKKTARLI